MYLIRQLCPRTDIKLGNHGFAIELLPMFREHVARSGIDQGKVNCLIEHSGGEWLKACGYSNRYRPREIRVDWGEWGPEHISVPGNACGLDIDRSPFGVFCPGAAMLTDHNIDCWAQKQLLLLTFTELAADVALFGRVEAK